MPICDEFVFSEGYSEDNTLKLIEQFRDKYPDKVRIVYYDWSAGHFTDIPKSTNVGIEAITSDYYINLQADEAIHEKYLPIIKSSIEMGDADIYYTPILHFWSSFGKVYKPGVFYDGVYRIARRECYPYIQSIWDGMTLGEANGKAPMQKAELPIRILHYGYVRKPRALIEKANHIFPWWGYELDKRFNERGEGNTLKWDLWHPPDKDLMDYSDTHPKVMLKWIAERESMVKAGILD